MIISVIVFWGGINAILAQPLFEPIFEGRSRIVNVHWSDNGSKLLFQETSIEHLEGAISRISGGWYEYQLGESGESNITISEFWPLQPNLTDLPITIASDSHGQISFVYLSPNQRYAVYASPRPAEWDNIGRVFGWPLTLTDLRSGDTTYIMMSDEDDSIISVSFLGLMNYYDIRWSDDSSAFTVEFDAISGDHRTYHVTNYMEHIEDTIASRVEIYSNGDLTGYGDVLDISLDGKRVLTVSGPNIFMWDSQDSKRRQYLMRTEKPPLAGMFVPDNEQKIVYLSETGLMGYDLETQETTVLDATINSEWVGDAWFSPDGKRVALTDKNQLYLYVIDVPLS